MGRADAEVGHPSRPVRLVRDLRHHHLRCACAGGRRRGARAAVVHDRGHPAEQFLEVDLPDDEAVVAVVDQGQVGPPSAQQNAATLRTDGLDGDSRGVLGGADATEARVHRRWAGVQERLQIRRQGPLVKQDPCARLHDVEVRRTRPRPQRRVARQPRLVAVDVVANVVHRWQSERRPVGVERGTVERLNPLGVHVPHRLVVCVRRKRLARPRQRRLMRRRQDARHERHAHVRDAQCLGYRPYAGGHQARCHQRVTVLRCRGHRLELTVHQLGRDPGRVRRRRRFHAGGPRAVNEISHRLPGRDHWHVDSGQVFREIRRCAHPHIDALRTQRHGESQHRLDVPA